MSSHVAASYLVERAVFRTGEFFRQWYVDGTATFLRRLGEGMRSIEAGIAVRETLRHFFQPLFRDYSVVGRIIGPFFRLGRLVIGLIAYAVLLVIFLAAYVVWLALPAFLILYVIRAAS